MFCTVYVLRTRRQLYSYMSRHLALKKRKELRDCNVYYKFFWVDGLYKDRTIFMDPQAFEPLPSGKK